MNRHNFVGDCEACPARSVHVTPAAQGFVCFPCRLRLEEVTALSETERRAIEPIRRAMVRR